VVGVADRVKTLAAQGSDGSFSGVREDDILTATLETVEHRRRVRGVSSSLGWGKGFGEEFAGMYRKKRNKRSNTHDMMDITFKLVLHALRLSGIDIPKNALLPSQLPGPVSSVNTKIWYRRESGLWAQLGEKIRPGKEGFFKRIRQKSLRSAICFRSARGLFALISRDCVMTWPERNGRMDG
jgi:hypothetical protein